MAEVSVQSGQPIRFKHSFRLSIVFHIAIFLLILASTLWWPSSGQRYIPALRVDVVDLPSDLRKNLKNLPKGEDEELKRIKEKLEKISEAAKKIKPREAPIIPPEETAAKNEMVLKPKKIDQVDPDKIKTQDRMKNALARITSLNRINQAVIAQQHIVIKGNQVSAGTTLSGEAKEAAEASYLDLLKEHLQTYWELPPWLARQNFSAQVRVEILSTGHMKNFRVIKSSGDERFDSRVIEALKKSSPFPAPPAGLAKSLAADGILVGFPL